MSLLALGAYGAYLVRGSADSVSDQREVDNQTYFAQVGQAFYDGILTAIDPGDLTFRVADRNPSSLNSLREVTLELHPAGAEIRDRQ